MYRQEKPLLFFWEKSCSKSKEMGFLFRSRSLTENTLARSQEGQLKQSITWHRQNSFQRETKGTSRKSASPTDEWERKIWRNDGQKQQKMEEKKIFTELDFKELHSKELCLERLLHCLKSRIRLSEIGTNSIRPSSTIFFSKNFSRPFFLSRLHLTVWISSTSETDRNCKGPRIKIVFFSFSEDFGHFLAPMYNIPGTKGEGGKKLDDWVERKREKVVYQKRDEREGPFLAVVLEQSYAPISEGTHKLWTQQHSLNSLL